MRKLSATLFALACLTFLATAAAAQDLKIGIVDMQQAMEQSKPGKKALSQLEEDFEKMKSDLNEEKSELEKMRQEIQKQSLVLSQEAKIDKETQYKNKVRDFQDMYKTYQQKMQLKEKKLRGPILEKMVQVIQDYGQDNGFTMIVEKNKSGIVYNQEGIEITQKIIERLNQTWEPSSSDGNS